MCVVYSVHSDCVNILGADLFLNVTHFTAITRNYVYGILALI